MLSVSGVDLGARQFTRAQCHAADMPFNLPEIFELPIHLQIDFRAKVLPATDKRPRTLAQHLVACLRPVVEARNCVEP